MIAQMLMLVCGHVLPPGDAERAIQVTVSSDAIRVDYQFGLGSDALTSELSRLSPAVIVPDDEVEAYRLHMELAAEEIGSRLVLTIGGVRHPMVLVGTDLIYKKHFRGSCQYEVDISSITGPVQVTLSDRNFPTYPGHGQLAAKKRGGLHFFDTTMAPILVRAEVYPIGSGDAFQPAELTFRFSRQPDAPAAQAPIAAEPQAAAPTANALTTPARSWTKFALLAALAVALSAAAFFAFR
jgi:hypothetical protein